MTSNYEKIKNKIKDSQELIYWYDMNGTIILIDSSKNESKKKIKKLKYNGLLYRLSITFHTGEKFGQGGVLSVECVVFNLENKNITKVMPSKNGNIWFDLDWLERMGWNQKYLNIIVKKLKGNHEFGIGIYKFTDLL